MAVPPGGRVSRLDDDRPAEGQRGHNVPRVYYYALRRAQAHGAAGGGKLLFIGQGQRGGWRAGKAVRPPQFGGTAGHKLGVAVGAGDEQPRSAGILLGQAQQRGGENAVPLKRWVLGGHLYNTAVGQRWQRTAADGQAAHAVCLIKAAGHTVDIGIPAQQHRQYLRHRNSPLPLVYAARGRLFFLPPPLGEGGPAGPDEGQVYHSRPANGFCWQGCPSSAPRSGLGHLPPRGKAHYFSTSGISSVHTPPLLSVTRTTYLGAASPSYSQPLMTASS